MTVVRAVFPEGEASPLASGRLLRGTLSELSYTGYNGAVFHLSGGQAPMAGVQNGIVLQKISGLQPAFTLLDNQGARQDGTTWLDSLYQPSYVHMIVEASGIDAAALRRVVRSWIGAWKPDQVGTLNWFSRQLGSWWMPVRQAKTFPDVYDKSPPLHRRQTFMWTARGDQSFWQGVDSTSRFTLPAGETKASGHNPVTNLGNVPVWPRHLVYGPGTFHFGNGAEDLLPGAKPTTMIKFGPLQPGQIALITTQSRLRSVVDLTFRKPQQPGPIIGLIQQVVEALVDFVTANDVPPLLQSFESLFGILPPQGPMYSLLEGRFTTPIPAKDDGVAPVTSQIPVAIEDGDANSKIVTSITPYRTYPE
jgi:hypothetical protein